MTRLHPALPLLALAVLAVSGAAFRPSSVAMTKEKPKPNMGDFIGLNTHTVQFRTDLYRPVTRTVRNYHPMDWDFDGDPSKPRSFPTTHNGVNWLDLYGGWRKQGFEIDASVQFESMDPEKWTDIAGPASRYGEAFGRYFGPSGEHKLVDSIEIGNEPMKFSEEQYRTMFESMAKGVRKGDPKMLVSTCAVALGKEDKWSKDVAILKGLEPLYDVLNVHTYAFAEGWPTWRRSYPEDPKINYLKQVQGIIDWRNANAPGKQVWVTEFGWDASTKKPEGTGDEAKFLQNTDTEQARYIVRSYLLFSAMDVDRAYLYWFNDEDKPSLHAASGLTRNYQPKPSYHAVAHLLKTLEGYRFSRVVEQKPGEVYAYEYVPVKGKGDRIWAVWSPTGSNRTAEVALPLGKAKVTRIERMPVSPNEGGSVETLTMNGQVTIEASESPTYLWIH